MDPRWLSNAWLVADRSGGSAVFIDAGAPVQPLLEAVDELGVRVTHVLLTHDHQDHTVHAVELAERYGAVIMGPDLMGDGHEVRSGDLLVRALATPGHCPDHLAFVIGDACFTGDVLFRDSVGGTTGGGRDGLAMLRHSVLDVVLALPGSTRLFPGHMNETTVERELAHNPFVRAWRGDVPEGDVAVDVAGRPATLLLRGGDYDGGTKAWVRFVDGAEAVVGGRMVSEREPA